MIKTYWKVEMTNNREDENGLRYGFFKKRQDVGLKFGSKNVEIFQKCCCSVDITLIV